MSKKACESGSSQLHDNKHGKCCSYLLNLNSGHVDGLDVEKIIWLEEEGTMFQGQADSFTARMYAACAKVQLCIKET